MNVNIIRASIICAVLCLAVLLLMTGCIGAYRMQQPLGPTKGDRLPVCDHAAVPKTCERT
jgi:hypothetical protein